MTRQLARRIVCRAAVLGATLALAVTAPLSASADAFDEPHVFECEEVNDEDLPTVQGEGCEWTSPVIIPDPIIIQPESTSWKYLCENGYAAGTQVTGYNCHREN